MTARTASFTLVLLIGWLSAACAMGGASKRVAQAATGPAPAATVGSPAGAALPDEKLVVTGSVSLSVDDGPAAIAALRGAVESAGGRVVHEQESGADHHWNATLRVRLPPGQVRDFLDAVGKVGRIDRRLIEATDVSRAYFDQELALANLRVTLDRLVALLANSSLQTADVLEIEREMTRVRGDLERIEGEHRFLQDRIAYATFELTLSGSSSTVLSARARLYPGVRGSMLYLVDAANGADRIRLGGAAVLAFTRQSSLELAIYPATDDTGRAVVVTAGGATYSDFFGAGLRRWLNPYLGARTGYAFVAADHAFVLTGELGVELYTSAHLTVDVGGRAHALIDGDGADAALEATAGLVVAF